MTELQQHFDRELWRWELAGGDAAGPAGLASLDLGAGITVHADRFDGRLLRLEVDTDDERGTIPEEAEELLRGLGVEQLRDHHAIGMADDVVRLVGRLAVLETERAHAEALGPVSGAWAAEAAALRAEVASLDTGSRAAPGPPTDAELGRARQALRELPTTTGRVVPDGPVTVDPSWITTGVLDLRQVRTIAQPGSGRVTVSAAVRDGIYAAAVTGISATLIEEATGIVVGIAPFGYDLVDGSPAAAAHVMVGAGRSLDSVSLWLTSDPSRRPSATLCTARRATELGRRAAQAERLGLRDDARRLLDEAEAEWARIGRSHPSARPATFSPFAGEISDLAELHDLS